MASITVKSYRILHKGDHTIDFQSTADDVSDVNIEYHAFVSLEGIYLIEKIDKTDESNIRTSYLIKRSSDGADFEADWNNHQTLNYVRYDKIMETFFGGLPA